MNKLTNALLLIPSQNKKYLCVADGTTRTLNTQAQNWVGVLEQMLISAGAAGLTYLLANLSGLDFGVWGAVAIPLLTAGIKYALSVLAGLQGQ